MKNERIYIRTTEKNKLKLLQKSQYYNMNLSDFVLGVAERACDLDVVQVWIHAYIDIVTRRDESGIINHYKTIEGDDAWNMPIFEDTYFSKVELLESFREYGNVHLPRMCDVLDQWDEFVRRLKVLGMWKESEL